MKKANLRSHLKYQQLDQILSERIKELYSRELGHQLEQITYQVFDQTLVILLEGAVTQPEQILNQQDKKELLLKVRSVLDQVIQSQIQQLIEEVMEGKVTDLLYDTTLNTGRTGMIAMIEFQPDQPSTLSSS